MRYYIAALKRLFEIIESEGGVIVYFDSYGGGSHAFATLHYVDADGQMSNSRFLLRTENAKTVVEREYRVEI